MAAPEDAARGTRQRTVITGIALVLVSLGFVGLVANVATGPRGGAPTLLLFGFGGGALLGGTGVFLVYRGFAGDGSVDLGDGRE